MLDTKTDVMIKRKAVPNTIRLQAGFLILFFNIDNLKMHKY